MNLQAKEEPKDLQQVLGKKVKLKEKLLKLIEKQKKIKNEKNIKLVW